MVRERSVLVVDRSEETPEVLRAVLERQGVRILAANRASEGLELARQHHPDLIVLDLEVDPPGTEEVATPFADATAEAGTPMVLLGSCRRPSSGPCSGEIIAKPYHYAPLIRKIEELLDGTGPGHAFAFRDPRHRSGGSL